MAKKMKALKKGSPLSSLNRRDSITRRVTRLIFSSQQRPSKVSIRKVAEKVRQIKNWRELSVTL